MKTRERFSMPETEVLRVEGLRVYYQTPAGPVKAVDGVSFALQPGERFGLVGESGSGKSTIALSLLRLIKPPGRIEEGRVALDGIDLLELDDEAMRRTRLAKISLVAQGAMNSLNPVKRIKEQIALGLRDHGAALPDRAFDRFLTELLEKVGLSRSVANMYPHELSGGMKQRVCIAIAISMSPKVIIADEPTSALDVVVQKQVLTTLGEVQEEIGAAVILVGHDMGLMAQFAHRIGVMYAGRLVEIGPVRDIFASPRHPYTQMLIASLPSLARRGVFKGIPGIAPSLLNPPSGCPFHVRCPRAEARCSEEAPALVPVGAGREAACHFAEADG
jgi:peptide/nickel transport system ATP-binding protein